MGTYYLYANLTKRQFVDSSDFEENIKFSGLFYGWSAPVLATLLVEPFQAGSFGEMAGAWSGDQVLIASDEASPTELFGLKTACDTEPDRNLYRMAHQEFENVTYKALGSLLSGSKVYLDECAETAARQLAEDRSEYFLILAYVTVITLFDPKEWVPPQMNPLQIAMYTTFGKDWQKKAATLRAERRSKNNSTTNLWLTWDAR